MRWKTSRSSFPTCRSIETKSFLLSRTASGASKGWNTRWIHVNVDLSSVYEKKDSTVDLLPASMDPIFSHPCVSLSLSVCVCVCLSLPLFLSLEPHTHNTMFSSCVYPSPIFNRLGVKGRKEGDLRWDGLDGRNEENHPSTMENVRQRKRKKKERVGRGDTSIQTP